jgi:hypothetical protein
MADFATAEWAAEAAELWPLLPLAPGLTAAVSFGILMAPRKEVAFHWIYQTGEVVSGAPGPVPDGPRAAAFTVGRADAASVLSGDVAPSVAFMRGRLKTAGDNGVVLDFLASTETDGFGEWLARLSGLAAA